MAFVIVDPSQMSGCLLGTITCKTILLMRRYDLISVVEDLLLPLHHQRKSREYATDSIHSGKLKWANTLRPLDKKFCRPWRFARLCVGPLGHTNFLNTRTKCKNAYFNGILPIPSSIVTPAASMADNSEFLKFPRDKSNISAVRRPEFFLANPGNHWVHISLILKLSCIALCFRLLFYFANSIQDLVLICCNWPHDTLTYRYK